MLKNEFRVHDTFSGIIRIYYKKEVENDMHSEGVNHLSLRHIMHTLAYF